MFSFLENKNLRYDERIKPRDDGEIFFHPFGPAKNDLYPPFGRIEIKFFPLTAPNADFQPMVATPRAPVRSAMGI